MTYRNDGSYVRFPESSKTVPEHSLESSSAIMDELIQSDQRKNHLRDNPAITASQNAFATPEE